MTDIWRPEAAKRSFYHCRAAAGHLYSVAAALEAGACHNYVKKEHAVASVALDQPGEAGNAWYSAAADSTWRG
jgi:hypothetical protein